mmetsp:Transcript_39388/g.93248  ORF Transcript_39388/g.93248 Transcript_39388/m.93248 type:complete len:414 (-) Transcript_39388:7301-8542(-)
MGRNARRDHDHVHGPRREADQVSESQQGRQGQGREGDGHVCAADVRGHGRGPVHHRHHDHHQGQVRDVQLRLLRSKRDPHHVGLRGRRPPDARPHLRKELRLRAVSRHDNRQLPAAVHHQGAGPHLRPWPHRGDLETGAHDVLHGVRLQQHGGAVHLPREGHRGEDARGHLRLGRHDDAHPPEPLAHLLHAVRLGVLLLGLRLDRGHPQGGDLPADRRALPRLPMREPEAHPRPSDGVPSHERPVDGRDGRHCRLPELPGLRGGGRDSLGGRGRRRRVLRADLGREPRRDNPRKLRDHEAHDALRPRRANQPALRGPRDALRAARDHDGVDVGGVPLHAGVPGRRGAHGRAGWPLPAHDQHFQDPPHQCSAHRGCHQGWTGARELPRQKGHPGRSDPQVDLHGDAGGVRAGGG